MTIEELAGAVNLNKSSVSRILNGKGQGHSSQTQKRVLDAAAALRYRPNPTARALATGATQIIELWMMTHEDYSPYFGTLHHCLHRIGVAHGYRLIEEDVSRTISADTPVAPPSQWPVDGILNCDFDPRSALYRHLTADRQIPIVHIGQEVDPDRDYVQLDVHTGAQEAVTHLLAAGCRRVGMVRSQADTRDTAYTEIMEDAGKGTEFVAASNHSRSAGRQALLDYVRTFGCPDGLFCANDELAIGCYLALMELGLRVPVDVLLVGFDGLENARLFPCPISSVIVPLEEMGRIGWELLVRRLSHPEAPVEQRVLVPRLEIRNSSRR